MSGGAADRERTALLEDLASGDEEVRRVPVTLVPGELTRVRP